VTLTNFGDQLPSEDPAYSQKVAARPSFIIYLSLGILLLMLAGAIYSFVFYL
jgi:flagellar basal body-associated protein FliL